ncbi:MAG: hypothetical protein ABSF23_12890 [Terracidiphilus sp.]|jgi:CHASE3 domain sensor protein
MTAFRNRRLQRKFAFSFGIVFTLSILQGLAALIGLYRIDRLTRDLTKRSL